MAPAHPNLVHVDDVDPVELDQGELRWSRRRLGAAAGADLAGLSRWSIAPGARSTPPHVHADEEEVCFVLRGSGLAWQDGTTYAVGEGDALLHRCDAEAHTLVAGPEGLDVLVFAEGSRTRLTFLPRTGQFWAGRRWIPADSAHPFAADAALPPLEVPPPGAPRPRTICHLDDVPARDDEPDPYGQEHRDVGGRLGRRYAGLRHTVLRPGRWSTPPHWHAAEEEAFYVLAGDGIARVGDVDLPLRPGSVLWRPPASGEAHALRAGDGGLTFLAFGTHRPDELVHLPRSGEVRTGNRMLRVSENER